MLFRSARYVGEPEDSARRRSPDRRSYTYHRSPDSAKDLGVGGKLEVRETPLARPGRGVAAPVHTENDDADSAMLRPSQKQIRLEALDVTVGNDDQERNMAREGVFRALVRIGEYGFELRKLYEHTEERPSHGLRRQDQHFPPVRAYCHVNALRSWVFRMRLRSLTSLGAIDAPGRRKYIHSSPCTALLAERSPYLAEILERDGSVQSALSAR